MSSVIPENDFSNDNVQSLSLKKTKKLKPEAEPTESLFTDILNNIKLVSLPLKWFAGYDYLPGIRNQMIIGFHQLSSFGDGFLRSIKKQIIMTKGIYSFETTIILS